MSKIQQRIILIVAVLVCGLAYGLQSWQKKTTPQSFDTTTRTMRLLIQDTEVRTALQGGEKFWLVTLQRVANDPISVLQHEVMGGLGSQVLAMQLVLHDAQERTEWQQSPHPEYGNIMQLYPPKAEIPAILKHLRACAQNCANHSRFLYLIAPQDLGVRYYGAQEWNVLALVQDIQHTLENK